MKFSRLLIIETRKRLARSLIRFMISLMFLPVLFAGIGLLIRVFYVRSFGTWEFLPLFYPLFFLVTILVSVGTVKEDVDDNSYVFVNILPFSKTMYYSARLLSSFILVFGSFAISLLLFYLTSFILASGVFSEFVSLWKYNLGFFFGLIAYCCVFSFFGTAFKKATIYSIIYFFFWEGIFGYAFFFLEKLTITYYMRNLLPFSPTSGFKSFFLMRQESITQSAAIAGLLVFSAVFYMAGLYVFRKKGYITGE